MKKNYSSPELEIVSLSLCDVLGASTYKPDPQDPVVSGVDDPIDDFD